MNPPLTAAPPAATGPSTKAVTGIGPPQVNTMLVCPECGERAVPFPPRAWIGTPPPAYSHSDRRPLCPATPGGDQPAHPVETETVLIVTVHDLVVVLDDPTHAALVRNLLTGMLATPDADVHTVAVTRRERTRMLTDLHLRRPATVIVDPRLDRPEHPEPGAPPDTELAEAADPARPLEDAAGDRADPSASAAINRRRRMPDRRGEAGGRHRRGRGR
jgi:hypothetical protein